MLCQQFVEAGVDQNIAVRHRVQFDHAGVVNRDHDASILEAAHEKGFGLPKSADGSIGDERQDGPIGREIEGGEQRLLVLDVMSGATKRKSVGQRRVGHQLEVPGLDLHFPGFEHAYRALLETADDKCRDERHGEQEEDLQVNEPVHRVRSVAADRFTHPKPTSSQLQ